MAQLSFVGAKPRPGPAPEGWRRASATVAQLYECGLSVKRVGELCGMSYGAAYSRLRKLGVTLRSRGASTAHAPETEQLAAWYDSGLSLEMVSRLAGISRSTVEARLVAHGTTIRSRSVRQKRSLTPDDLRRARLYSGGLSIQNVADREGLSYGVVRKRLIAAGVTIRTRKAAAALLRRDIDTALLERVYRLTGSSTATGQVLRISRLTVLVRLREAGIEIQPRGRARMPDPGAALVHIAEPSPWEVRDRRILTSLIAGQRTARIAADLRTSLHEVHEVQRVYGHPDRTAAHILRRRHHGEHPGVIAVRLGIRPVSVLRTLARVSG